MCCLYCLFLREKLGVWGFLLIVWFYAWGEVYDESVLAFPTSFDMGIVSVAQCIRVIHLDFSSFSVLSFSWREVLCV